VRIVVLGLSITSSWGNGHATNYRALCSALLDRGHEVSFLERDVPWYAANRDFQPSFVRLYGSLAELRRRHVGAVRDADLVIVGSFVPEGIAVGDWALGTASGIVAFWDIDTPVTAERLAAGSCEYLTKRLVASYDLYLSFTGGPFLEHLGARRPRSFYCVVDEKRYRPMLAAKRYALGYLGTYSRDRQAALDRLLVEPARRLKNESFVVAGPQYPATLAWPRNVTRVLHVPPSQHTHYFAVQRLTLNVTRRAMVDAGWSPSVRLFEAAACGVPILSDHWPGLAEFFVPNREILVAHTSEEAAEIVTSVHDRRLSEIADAARRRVLAEHTAARRAEQLEGEVAELLGRAA
jgi:spore maturation protein CgeB